MHRDFPGIDAGRNPSRPGHDKSSQALAILLEARERLLEQMADEIVSHREELLGASGEAGMFSFELQEIEDRYSARLTALNALVENLEYRQPQVDHRVETAETTLAGVQQSLERILRRSESWDLVDFEVVRLEDDRVFLVTVLARDEPPEDD